MTLLLAMLACSGEAPAARDPLPADTGDAQVITIDTADFIPVDTAAPVGTEDLIPDNLLTIAQVGQWTMSPLGGPYTDVAGTLEVREHIDALDPEEPEYACDVRYTLTGQVAAEHTCDDCDVVFDVEFFVNEGDPTACREPDTPQHQVVWRLGVDEGREALMLDYGGTGVWVRWMDAETSGADVNFSFEKVVAIQVEEEEEP
jgi:hypothetical protein